MENEDLNNEYKSRNAFKVPEDYFENFDASVLKRIQSQGSSMTVWHSITKWSIAASIIIVAGVGVFLYSHQIDDSIDISTASISDTELESYRSAVEVSDELFIELLSKQAVDSIYNAEIIAVSNNVPSNKEIENIEEEYSPLDDIEI